MTFNTTDPVDQPLTLEELAKRVAAIEERIGGVIPQLSMDGEDFNRLEVERLKKENEQLRLEVLRLGGIVRTFNQQSVSISPDLADIEKSG